MTDGKARLGFGVSGPLGRKWFSEKKTQSLIGAALDGGVAYFDTAPFYGDAESRLGRALRDAGAQGVFVSTKTGTRRDGRGWAKDFSEVAIRRDVETSLAVLNRSCLDLLYLHGPTADQIDRARPVLDALKREGLIRRAGVCGEGAAIDHAVKTRLDAVMTFYSVIDRRHARVLSEAKAQGLMTTAIGPLAVGALDRRFAVPLSISDLWRTARSVARRPYRAEAVAAARAALRREDPAGTALAFALANRDLDVVPTTTTKRRHLDHCLSAARKPLAPDVLASIQRLALTEGAAAPS
ncbi:MAG: aldo/keto reductase [Parvularculaceae bacterium]|nr:aldo/keto reductase [Parvularculaceae bacterium]